MFVLLDCDHCDRHTSEKKCHTHQQSAEEMTFPFRIKQPIRYGQEKINLVNHFRHSRLKVQ